MKRILILLLYLPMLAWAQPLETIGLRHRMADQDSGSNASNGTTSIRSDSR